MSAAASLDLSVLDDLSPEERRALAAGIDDELRQDQLQDYRPYRKQREFHAAGASHRERLLRAGNQQGKSLSAGAEWAMHLCGEYAPWWRGRRFSRPILAWAAGETAEATRDNPQRVLLGYPGEEGTGWIPRRCIEGADYGMSSGASGLYDYIRVRHVRGGWSMLRFRNYAQGRRKWQGPPVDALWCDEEPPVDVYDEGLARTIATGGIVAITFTPLQGMSDVVSRFLKERHPQRHDTNMTIYDAEHIDPDDRDAIIMSFPAHERRARAMGEPTLGSGRIYPVEESRITVEPFAVPAHWPVIGGVDFGWDHPFAAIKLAWDRESDAVYVTNAYRRSQEIPAVHFAALRAWGPDLPWSWPADGYQHEKGTGIQLAEQYRQLGMRMLHEHAQYPEQEDDTRTSRVSVEAGIQDILERMMDGRFFVFAGLGDWFEEFRLYHRDAGKIIKVGDDLLDATRYAVMMLRHARTLGRRQSTLQRPPPNWRAA